MRTTLLFGMVFFAACSIDRAPARSEQAGIVSPDLVIANVYGGGGNASATYNQDFVVVFNRGSVAASLTGVKLYYASQNADFSAGNATTLGTATLAPGATLLVGFATGTTGAGILPDVTNLGLNLGAATAKLALSDQALACGSAGTQCDPADWIDLVGWGSAGSPPSQAEGTYSAGTSNNAKSLARGNLGCVDTGDNATDIAVVTVTAPRSSATAATPCSGIDMAGTDLSAPDLSVPPDLTMPSGDLATPQPDLYGYSLLLNEVKWNPAGADNGQEFIELIGQGTIPANTYVVSVDGDGTAGGRINFVQDVSGLTLGSNGLLLIKGATTTIPGVDAATTVVDSTALNGLPLQNGTESVLIIHATSPLTIVAGSTNYTTLTNIIIFDSIAAADTSGTTFGGALIAPCPSSGGSPVDGAYRIVGDTRAQTAAAWYAGQAIGAPVDQFLDKVSVCSAGPATASMSPGRPNDMPLVPAPDLAPAPPSDLAVSHDLATNHDLASNHDLAGVGDLASGDDASVTSGNDMATGRGRNNGCAIGASDASASLPMVLVAIAMLVSITRARRSSSFRARRRAGGGPAPRAPSHRDARRQRRRCGEV